ncbi:MAG: rRNA maturation RNase YbeY [Hellea sp.]|nr:rRNA maturation RNase YbeY [Hellea sp.]MDG1666575.1 rRNA maturation RNase YbeY [Hellea sp.]MDG2361961.1 rRNA maturation RNase YbeY [Hellea sp.]
MSQFPFNFDVSVRAKQWGAYKAYITDVTPGIIDKILTLLERPIANELSIALVDDKEIQFLNKKFRDKNKATNVLSFPSNGPAPILGEIILSYETLKKEAEELLIPFKHHLIHMLVHGFLHLQGFDHQTDEDAAAMEKLEVRVLSDLNIDNPYKIKDE